MKRLKILLVEDNDAVREVLKRQLEALGVLVIALSEGSRAKEFMAANDFDLVIADLQLPDCSGVDIARFARAHSVRVVLLSGESGLGDRPDIAFAGFEEILTKPISLSQLQNMLIRFGLIAGKSAMPEVEPVAKGIDADDAGVLDLNVIREQMGDLDELSLKMLSRFPDMMKPLSKKIQTSVSKKDLPQLSEAAHSLKGAARSAGAMHLGKLCEQVQDLAQNGVLDMESVQSLLDEFTKVEKAILKLCA